MVIAAKLTGLIQTMATLNNLVAAKLYNLLFSVLPPSSGTSGHAS